MSINDHYFVELTTKPTLLFYIDYSLYGFFQTKSDLAHYLVAFAEKISGVSDLHLKIFDEKKQSLIEDFHFSMSGKKGSLKGKEVLDFLNREENMLFINKYLDISDLKTYHEQYVAEFVIQRASKKDSVVLAYFSSISEFVKILTHLHKKVREEGNINFTIDHINSISKRLTSRSYKMFENGSILIPEMEKHYIDLKDTKDLQLLSLYIWENDFTDKIFKP
jgi:hypothetical protein